MRSIQKCNISHEKYTAKFVIYRKKKKKYCTIEKIIMGKI